MSGAGGLVKRLQELSIPLLAGVVAGLVFANLDYEGYEHLVHASPLGEHLNLHFFANEIIMVFFFGIAAKEITEACLPGGVLNPVRKAINPLLGTLGGVLGPVAVYFAMVKLFDAPEIARGWGVPTATDIALAWLVARVVFGARHAAVSFLLLLAIADDAIGLGIIAVFYPDPQHPVELSWLGAVAAAMVAAWLLRRRGVLSFWPYVLGCGGLSWVGLYQAHLHPALALVAVVPFMPNRGRDEGLFAEYEADYPDTLNHFEHFFRLPVDLGLFVFGFANAGVTFAAVGPATWSVLLALLVGKTVGISALSLLGRAIGFPLPQGMNVRTLFLAALTGALGLTVALFVAGVAFVDPMLQGSAKMGALFSSVAAPLVIVLGRLLRVERKVTAAAGELDRDLPSLHGRDLATEEEMDLDASAGEPRSPGEPVRSKQ